MPNAESSKLEFKKWLWITILVITLDQISKILADHFLQYHQPVSLMPMFNFTLMYNPGAAFSFLANQGGWQRWFFLALTSIVSVFIFLWIRKLKPQQVLQYTALALILGHVIDFLDVYYQQHHWPAFNIADSAISVGAVLLIYDAIKNSTEESNENS